MSQHPAVARFYDEHTQELYNNGNPKDPLVLAKEMLEDGRQLSADYEKLQAALKNIKERGCKYIPNRTKPAPTCSCMSCTAWRGLLSTEGGDEPPVVRINAPPEEIKAAIAQMDQNLGPIMPITDASPRVQLYMDGSDSEIHRICSVQDFVDFYGREHSLFPAVSNWFMDIAGGPLDLSIEGKGSATEPPVDCYCGATLGRCRSTTLRCPCICHEAPSG